MPKPIYLTQELREQAVEEFKKAVESAKMSDGKFSYNKNFTYKESEKAKILFTSSAYAKMIQLLMSFDSEVAWHGVGCRLTGSTFVINDILVYPQTVTGTTVTMDEEEYAKWIYENIEDERFDNIVMQGHSHVKMQTSPSATDIQHQEVILSQLRPDKFYIFMIWNQRMENNTKIYDMLNNTLFETSEITYGIYDEECDISEFIADAKSVVKNKVYNTQTYTGGNTYYGSNYYSGQQYTHGNNTTTQTTQQTITEPTKKEKKKEKAKKNAIGGGWAGRGSEDMVDAGSGYYHFDRFDT